MALDLNRNEEVKTTLNALADVGLKYKAQYEQEKAKTAISPKN